MEQTEQCTMLLEPITTVLARVQMRLRLVDLLTGSDPTEHGFFEMTG
jgi:hypothetical protein